MPGLVVTIGGNATPFSREVARAEAIALGFQKNLSRQSEALAAASMARLKSQASMMDSLRAQISGLNGTSMMSAAESAAKDEAIRLTEVEEAARRNTARKLLRQRKADAAASAKEIAAAELAAEVEAATRSNMARRLLRERAAKRAVAAEVAAAKTAAEAATARSAIFDVAANGIAGRAGGGLKGIAGLGSSGTSQLISVFSNTASSLGSGMSIGRIFAQQAPNVLQAFTLMGSKIPFLNKLINDTRLQSEKTAESLAIQAVKTSVVAQADILAAEKEAALTGATSASTLAAQTKAEASTAAALADQKRAAAAAEAAAAERAQAGAAKLAIGPLGIIAGIVAGLAIGAYAAWKQSSALIDKLSGFKPPDFNPEYIAKHLQKINQGLEIQKAITKEIEKQKELYNSAAAVAERTAAATKSHFDKLRQLNQLSNKPESLKIREEARINAEERAAELQNKRDEQKALETEGAAKQAEATRILTSVSSKEHDQNNINYARAKMEAAQKALDDLNKARDKNNPAGISADQVFRAYNAATASNVSGKDLDAAAKQIQADASSYRKQYQTAVDQSAANDVVRTKGEEFATAAAEAMGKAENIKAAMPDLEKQAAQKNSDEQQLANARIRNQGGGNKGFVTERERIGLGASSSIQVSILDTAKRSLAVQQALLQSNQELRKEIYEAGGF